MSIMHKMYMYMCIYVHTYMYTYIHVHIHRITMGESTTSLWSPEYLPSLHIRAQSNVTCICIIYLVYFPHRKASSEVELENILRINGIQLLIKDFLSVQADFQG